MTSFLDALGKRLADRWLQLLVLPGALYLAAAIAARTLGQSRPFDPHRLTTQIVAWAKAPAASTIGGQVVLLAAALAGSAAAGLAAQALGALAERLTLAAEWTTWIPPLRQLTSKRVERRQRSWDSSHLTYSRLYLQALEDVGTQPDPARQADRHAAYRARMRIATERPERPTWSGDRIQAVTVRLQRDLHLHLPTIWAALWLILPNTARTELTSARQTLASAATQTAWAVLYALLAGLWWPAALIALALAITGWHRIRTSTHTYALLLEATARLYAPDLARQLGEVDIHGFDASDGDRLTATLYTAPALADEEQMAREPRPGSPHSY